MTRIGIVGSAGQMGKALKEAIAAAGHDLAGGVDQADGDVAGRVQEVARQSDVLVDFSAPDALSATLAAAVAAEVPVLIGTTGLDAAHLAAIDRAASRIAVLQTGNTSLGVAMLAHVVRETAARLGPQFDIEIVEMHHRMKIDAPSGTALLLAQAAAQGRGIALADHMERGRDGSGAARDRGAIGFASLRGGTVAGEHSVIFAGDDERVVLSHQAENRMVFARGAVRAACWLIGKPPGRFTMAQVLDLQ
ncbi:4-hydroxy-tetrahydrodipicolinate reductase [Croceicoccus sp. F390]|uniref:4-hydroxy-tetrahydrodipicolinate reductase n=1 Tax=Croceicoccus esteveae TaxID=3075597 RepID=A0ABU2ZGY0_9SPHN|nr:4-hydroxy-tetrahydrodipicolinate reductase [Croceicoccus sp. F390]MDT0575466.1 4-hydroxy-tetrahydrodipicolinate reductase [Croceicoccus sp. F390]